MWKLGLVIQMILATLGYCGVFTFCIGMLVAVLDVWFHFLTWLSGDVVLFTTVGSFILMAMAMFGIFTINGVRGQLCPDSPPYI